MNRVRSDGVEIYYESHGEGRPLVFAHGAGGNAASWWQQVPFFVAHGYRVLCFDHRGFGRSRCAPTDFQPERFPADLRSLLDAEGIERAALVCQSMGGWSGLPLALESPERVSALVLSGTPGGIWTQAVAEAFGGIGERIAREGGIVGPGGAALGASFRRDSPAGAFLYDRIAGFNPELPPEALARLTEIRLGPAELADHRVPTLVVSGDEDLLFPPAALDSVAAALPGTRLERLGGVGHSSYFEQPARFNGLVLGFLEEHRGG